MILIRSPLYKLLRTTRFWQDHYLILREFKYFPRVAILAIVFSLLAAALEGVGIGLLMSFLQSLTTPDAAAFQTGIEWLDQWVLGSQASATNRLYRLSGIILLTTWLRSTLGYLSSIYTETTQFLLMDRLRKQIFEQLQAVQLKFFVTTRSGELVNTITTEIERFKTVFSGTAFLITRLLTSTVYFTALFLISWQVTIAALLLFTLLIVGISTLNARVREAGYAVSIASENFTSRAIEFINGIRTVHAFAAHDFERQRYYRASSDLVSTSKRAVVAMAIVRPLGESIATTILIVMIVVSFTFFVAQGTLQVASLLTFFFVLFRLAPILQEVNGTRMQLNFVKGAADRLKKLLQTQDKTYFDNGTQQFLGLRRAIEFVAVDFGYDPLNLVLQDITLTIEQGKMTALIGSSGAGKSTLVDLIPRFYDPTQGQIRLDGVDLCQFEVNSLRRKLAVVSQDTFIFNASVRDNIAYGSPEASEAEVIEAAQWANALDFIRDMPEGFDTLLGDRGVRLSGGQRQRLAIARALLRNPEILILDEATSALDSISERLIQDAIEKLSVGRTVVAIAHRLSTIAKADKVVVLEQGRIVEQGKYQELLEQHSRLWKYHQMQHESGASS
ncbi:heterocyst formation ABC transporter subunit HepA [Phormidesmis sp. 146-33]